jgi:tetratricopeptide (TPR) repeat protein
MNFTYSEPHNEWIRILSETGIPGFILAVFLFFIPPLLVFWRVLFSAVKPPVETLFYASFILGLYLFACFDFPLRRIEHNVILWSVFAFMIHKVSLYGTSVKVFLPERKALIIILFLIPTVFTILIAAARLRGEYYTLQIFRNEHRNDGKVIAGCRKAENVFYHITPNTLPVSWFEGVAHFRMGEIKDAEQCFRKALMSTPYEVRVLNDYSTALFNNGNTEAAIRVLQKTLYLDPFFDDARLNLGVLYYLTGRRSDALFHVRKCRDSHRKQELLLEMN